MIVLLIIIGIIVWFGLGILGYIIYQKFGSENLSDEFGLFFAMGGLTFAFGILLVIYEHIRDFITDRF